MGPICEEEVVEFTKLVRARCRGGGKVELWGCFGDEDSDRRRAASVRYNSDWPGATASND